MIRIHGIDTGSSMAIVTMDQQGRILAVWQADKANQHKGKVGKKAAKKKPATDPIPPLRLWQTWGDHSRRVWRYLMDTLRPGDVAAIEAVKRHAGIRDAHAYGRGLAVVEMAARVAECEMVEVGVSSAKMTATGHGRADKTEMIAAAVRQWGERDDWTEHTADAAWVAETARRGQE